MDVLPIKKTRRPQTGETAEEPLTIEERVNRALLRGGLQGIYLFGQAALSARGGIRMDRVAAAVAVEQLGSLREGLLGRFEVALVYGIVNLADGGLDLALAGLVLLGQRQPLPQTLL